LILPNNVTTITGLHIEFDADQREKNATPTGGNDPDDAPELTEEFFAQADEYVGGQWVRRGRPKAGITKLSLTVRYDADVIDAF
jgi:uncharacterized protein (DUF4415 family)